MSTPTPSHTAGQALALALEVLRADRQALIDCHGMDGTIPEADELAAQALAQYSQAISALESLQTCRQRAPAPDASRDRYAALMQAVEWLLTDGHMDQEHLARLRAAWEGAAA